MPVTVKDISLWRREAESKIDLLAQTPEPPDDQAKRVIGVDPVTGKNVTAAPREMGLAASAIPTLLVEGDNKPGPALNIAQTIADSGGDLSFFVAQA